MFIIALSLRALLVLLALCTHFYTGSARMCIKKYKTRAAKGRYAAAARGRVSHSLHSLSSNS